MSFLDDDPLKIFAPKGTDSCKALFNMNILVNMIVGGIAAILAILLIVKITLIAKSFFLTTYVKHDATSWDDDIIIIAA